MDEQQAQMAQQILSQLTIEILLQSRPDLVLGVIKMATDMSKEELQQFVEGLAQAVQQMQGGGGGQQQGPQDGSGGGQQMTEEEARMMEAEQANQQMTGGY